MKLERISCLVCHSQNDLCMGVGVKATAVFTKRIVSIVACAHSPKLKFHVAIIIDFSICVLVPCNWINEIESYKSVLLLHVHVMFLE